MRELQTAREVIEALGGAAATRALTGKTPQHIWNWKSAGRFPAETYLIMSNELGRQGVKAPATLWGIAEPERAAS